MEISSNNNNSENNVEDTSPSQQEREYKIRKAESVKVSSQLV